MTIDYKSLEEIGSHLDVFVDGDWVESKDQDPEGSVRLIQLADIGDGNFRNRSARFLTKEKAKELNCTFLKKDDVLVARMPDPLGRSCTFPLDEKDRYVTVVDVCIIRPKTNAISPKYLQHCINSPQIRHEISALQSGSTRKRISRGNLATIKLPIVKREEQDKIVSKIETLFEEIEYGTEELHKAKQQLDLYKQSVLNSAIQGKLTPQNPNDESAASLLEKAQKERAMLIIEKKLKKEKLLSPIDPKELPFSIPAGWSWVRIVDIAANIPYAMAIGPFGSNLKVPDYTNEGVPLIFVRNIRSGNFGGTYTKYVNPNKAKELSAHSAKGGDVLITKMGEPPGDACVYPINSPNAIITADCIKVTTNDQLISAEYLAHLINSPVVKPQILDKTQGVAQKKVSLERFREILIPLPPREEQNRILDALNISLSDYSTLYSDIETKIVNTSILKQSILKSAFEGKLL